MNVICEQSEPPLRIEYSLSLFYPTTPPRLMSDQCLNLLGDHTVPCETITLVPSMLYSKAGMELVGTSSKGHPFSWTFV